VNLGASSHIVKQLVKTLYGLCFSRRAATSGLPTAQITIGNLVASLKGLKATSVISQADPVQNVKINTANLGIYRLNTATMLISILSEKVVQKLSNSYQNSNSYQKTKTFWKLVGC
jgi:hypothetical protein